MSLNYEKAKPFLGKMIRFQNDQGEWIIGKVTDVTKDGLEIQELNPKHTKEGYGYGWGWGPGFYPWAGIGFVAFWPWFFW